MESIDEETFKTLFLAGAVKFSEVFLRADGLAHIHFSMASGGMGVVHTKRGYQKTYRVETALHLLRSIGHVSVCIDMAAWNFSEQQ